MSPYRVPVIAARNALVALVLSFLALRAPAAPPEARAGDLELLVGRLSLREKAAQVLLIAVEGRGAPSKGSLDLLASLPVGGVLLFGFNLGERPVELADFTATLQDGAASGGTGIPLFVAIDHEGGSVFRFRSGAITRLPPAAEVGRLGPRYAEALGRAAGTELRALGVNLALAPVVELGTDENRKVLGTRTYGRDPATVDAAAGAFIEGLQSAGIAAVAKHFPGNGAADPHEGLPRLAVGRASLERDFLPRFRSAIGRGVGGVMLSHVLVPALDPGRPATLSPAIVGGALKEGLGFEGVAITDDLYMKALSIDAPPERLAVQALRAGADLLMLSTDAGAARIRDAIERAVEAGALAEERLDDAVRRCVALKLRFGMGAAFDRESRARMANGFEDLVERNRLMLEALPR